MYRFFSFAVLFNWLIVIAMIGLVGLGLSADRSGMMSGLTSLLVAEAPFGLSDSLARAISIGASLSVLTAALWAIMAVLFADDSDQHSSEQDFVISVSLGFCLILFACLIALSVGVGQYEVGALASVASYVTVLAGVAQRVFSAEERARTAQRKQVEGRFSLVQAQSMASQSAKLASVGARSSRFVPKAQHHTYYSNS